MRGRMNDRDAKCPFFCGHTKESVLCEGLIPDSRIKINFADVKTKDIQYNVFCSYKFENCEMYQALMERYRDDE